MKYTIFTILTLLQICIYGQESQDLVIELNIYKSHKTGNNTADVILINKGDKTITIPSKGLGRSYGASNGKGQLTINSKSGMKWNGVEIMDSVVKYEPVILQPNEGTIYKFKTIPFGSPFDKIRGKATSYVVSFDIPKDFAQRFGWWHGKVSSKTFLVKDDEIQPLKEK